MVIPWRFYPVLPDRIEGLPCLFRECPFFPITFDSFIVIN